MKKVCTPIPPARHTASNGTAFPPLPKGQRALTMAEWDRQRGQRRPWWRRLIGGTA